VSTLAPTSKHVFIEADIFVLELDEKYKEADIGLLYTEPSEYRTFAVPYKLFEYMSYRLPIIATSGTWAGNFVQDNNIGWVIPYNAKEFKALTKDLINNKEEVQSKRRNIEKILPMHTWESRARKVKHELAGNN
jgi:glycosyltransferase involved in cell wall biosynthesis